MEVPARIDVSPRDHCALDKTRERDTARRRADWGTDFSFIGNAQIVGLAVVVDELANARTSTTIYYIYPLLH